MPGPGTRSTSSRSSTVSQLAASVTPLAGEPRDLDAIVRLAAGKRFVLIGEASHGTHEFYRVRAEITKRLIRERRVAAVAIEGDWPDAYQVNRFVRGERFADAEEALGGFRRFPHWMWRNADVLDFVGWLRAWNEEAGPAPVGFYGLDLYSLHASIEAVLAYLRTVDPDAARQALERYACFDQYGGDPQAYGYATAVERLPSCEADVVRQLVELRVRSAEYAGRDGRLAPDDQFFAEQNARVVVNAEQYYRAMYRGGAASWNLRDRHMAASLDALAHHLDIAARGTTIVVWAHNSHLGDARATDAAGRGEVNLGQLVREAAGDQSLVVGFTTYDGSVTAASDWDEPAERMRVRPALDDSVEALFHASGVPRFLIHPGSDRSLLELLNTPRLQRFIGVIYRPDTERMSHYFRTRVASQYDVILHYDRTRAVEPLERTAGWDRDAGEVPETYPSAL